MIVAADPERDEFIHTAQTHHNRLRQQTLYSLFTAISIALGAIYGYHRLRRDHCARAMVVYYTLRTLDPVVD